MARSDYRDRLVRERETFADQQELHQDLPPAFHHWSARHVAPKLRQLGLTSLDDAILEPIRCRAMSMGRDVVVLSLGSGNGDLELGWLGKLQESGVDNVRLRLLELNPIMQERAARLAAELGLGDRVELLVEDFNTWRADAEHDVVIGHHALHHVLALEHLFDEIRSSLTPQGVLIAHDIIGRNGHRRWPEALEVVERIWCQLPPRLRVSAITGVVDDVFCDLDCATDGFEGIRAQDVLPAMLDRFYPGLFFTFGNVIDPFIDRIYGGNYDLEDENDRSIIENIGALDDALIELGTVTPTHLIGTFHPNAVETRCYLQRTPERAVRDPGTVDRVGRISFDPAANDRQNLVRGAVVCGRINGLYEDGWVGPSLELPLYLTEDVKSIEVTTYLPDWMPENGEVNVIVNEGQHIGRITLRHGLGGASLPVVLAARQSVTLGFKADWDITPARSNLGKDRRRLSYLLKGLAIAAS